MRYFLLAALALGSLLAQDIDKARSLMTLTDKRSEAEALLRHVIQTDPNSAEAQLWLGILLEWPLRDSVEELRNQVLPLYRRGLELREQDPAVKPADLAFALELNARLLDKLDLSSSAESSRARATTIRRDIIRQMSPHQADAQTPAKVSSIKDSPRFKAKTEPAYSEEARLAKQQGTAVFQIVVGVDGTPANLVLLRSLGFGLDEKAAEALLKWRFDPGMKDGAPVPVIANVEVNFRLLQAQQKGWAL